MKKLLRDPITQNSINEKKQIFETPLKLGDENCKVYVIKSKDCKQPIISEYDSRYTTQPKAYRTFHHASDNSSSESENIYDEIDFREGNQAIDKPELTFIHDENNCIV
uniref:ATS domain-containing protein n=1 Tax=Heterorhabditis bacteriophora TaxID=37862 RepID=A0A1I7XK00_HETBA